VCKIIAAIFNEFYSFRKKFVGPCKQYLKIGLTSKPSTKDHKNINKVSIMEKGKPKGTMVGFKKKAGDVLFNYSQTSTIAGFHYIFEPKLSVIGKAFWFVLVVMLTAIGAYLSILNYGQWKSEPVIITLKSTGLPVSKVDFPSGALLESLHIKASNK